MKSMPSSRPPVLRILSAVALATAALLLAGCGKDEKQAAKPATSASGFATDEQKVSYGVGYNMGKNLAGQTGFAVDHDALKAGLEDALTGGKLRVPEEDLQKAFQGIQVKVQAVLAAEGQKQLAEGTAFLTKNKGRSGVKTTASGLQYEVLKSAGKGPKPKPTDTVVVAYHGTLTNGAVFDSSVERGDTATFPLNQVIAGW